jgi:hypothetical protein
VRGFPGMNPRRFEDDAYETQKGAACLDRAFF